MTGYAVQDGALNLVSLGTLVADPLPAGLTAVALSDADYRALLSGAKIWQAGSAVANPNDPAIGEQRNTALRDKLAADFAAIGTLGQATGTVTRAQFNAALKAIRNLQRVAALGADGTVD